MAFSINVVATATPGTASPRTITYNGRVGRLYVAVLSRSGAADAYTGLEDDAENTWTRQTYAPTSGAVGRRIEMWTCIPTTAFNELVASFSGSSTAHAALVEITGHDPDFLDQVDSDFRSSNAAPARLEVTPEVEGVLGLAAVQANNNTNSQIHESSGWIRLSTQNLGPALAYRTDILPDVPVGVDWTFDAAQGSGHAIMTIIPGPDAPPLGAGVSVWDGAEELPAYIEGIWDGEEVLPALFDTVA